MLSCSVEKAHNVAFGAGCNSRPVVKPRAQHSVRGKSTNRSDAADLVRFQNRRYSPDTRRLGAASQCFDY